MNIQDDIQQMGPLKFSCWVPSRRRPLLPACSYKKRWCIQQSMLVSPLHCYAFPPLHSSLRFSGAPEAQHPAWRTTGGRWAGGEGRFWVDPCVYLFLSVRLGCMFALRRFFVCARVWAFFGFRAGELWWTRRNPPSPLSIPPPRDLRRALWNNLVFFLFFFIWQGGALPTPNPHLHWQSPHLSNTSPELWHFQPVGVKRNWAAISAPGYKSLKQLQPSQIFRL